MEIFRVKNDIPFLKYRKIAAFISILTFVMAFFFLFQKGLNYGVDFTGGTIIEISYEEKANVDEIREQLTQINLNEIQVQNFGTDKDVLIRMPLNEDITIAELSELVNQELTKLNNPFEIKRVESVGGQVGEELFENGALAILFVCLGIILYLSLRFEWRFALAAVVANMHDVIIILGFFAFFQWEFNLTVLAAVLAVLGYSVNESVVVFDRVRENLRKYSDIKIFELTNISINETLSRTLITSITTLLALFAIFFFGGEILKGFSLAMIFGVIFGTYSSIYIANTILVRLNVSQKTILKEEEKI